jgi:hypothetical protein
MFRVADFYLLDLERTIGFNKPFYWKGNKRGYTSSIRYAGIFSEEKAEMIVASDLDKRTVMISRDMVYKFLGKEKENHEGNININTK